MKKKIILAMAIIAIVCCSSAVSAGLFDFGSDDGPVAGKILESNFNWQTNTKIVADDSNTQGGLVRIELDENGNADINTTDVNNLTGTLKINLTNITDSQLKSLNESVEDDMGDLIIVVDNDDVKEPLAFPYSSSHVSLDGKVLTIDFTNENVLPPILEGSGSCNVTSGNITFVGDKDIEILF